MRRLAEKILSELRDPAAKRTMGGDRDPGGFFVMILALTDEEAEANADVLFNAEMPGNIDCLTCRFAHRQWGGEPCFTCLDSYTTSNIYPKWRRG